MSSYFDAYAERICDLADEALTDDGFLEAVRLVEAQMFNEVIRITGDWEFPDDLRMMILSKFAIFSVWQPGTVPVPERAKELLLCTRYSRLVEEVHELFHELAGRRIEVRFGRLTDSPTDMIVRRNEHDEAKGREL